MNWHPGERRQWPRVDVPVTAEVLIGGTKIGYVVSNLSAGGAQLIGPGLPRDQELRIQIQFPTQPITVTAIVRRVQSQDGHLTNCAVEFINQNEHTQTVIEEAVLAQLSPEQNLQQRSVILVVDDSSLVRHALRKELQKLGRTAVTATGALEAQSWLNEPSVHISIALVDRFLETGDGLGLLDTVGEHAPLTRRVLMSAHLHDGQLELHKLSGRVDEILYKPWETETLTLVTDAN